MLWSSRLAIAALLSPLLLWAGQPLAAQPAPTDLYGDPLPAGAVARLGTIRFRAGGFRSGLAFLPDSKTFVTAAEETGIQFWEAETGRLLREIRVEPMSIQGFAISKDGAQIAVAGYWYPEDRSQGAKGECRVLDAATGQTIKTLPRESRDVNNPSLAFSPDGKSLRRGGGADGTFGFVEADCPLLTPGENVTFIIDAALDWQGNELRLGGSDGLGGNWLLHDLKPGPYKVRIRYQNHRTEFGASSRKQAILDGAWTGGEVETPSWKSPWSTRGTRYLDWFGGRGRRFSLL